MGPAQLNLRPNDQVLSGESAHGVLGHDLPSSLKTLSLFENNSSKSPDAEKITNLYGIIFPSFRIQNVQWACGASRQSQTPVYLFSK